MDTTERVGLERSQAASFYSWEVPGKPISLRLACQALDRILLHAVGGMGRITRGRGAEVGGLLLGTAERSQDRRVVRIEDFEPVACEHMFGPSYTLSVADRQKLSQALERWKPAPGRRIHAVGYCRSHTRDELALSPEDVELFCTYFSDPASVALVVKPRATGASAVGFFFWEDGEIRSDAPSLEFTFEGRITRVPLSPDQPLRENGPRPKPAPVETASREAASAEPAAAAEPAPAPAGTEREPAAEPAPAEVTELPDFSLTLLDSAPRRPKRRWIWALPFVLLVGAGLGLLATRYFRVPGAPVRDPLSLSLVAQEYNGNLHLTWDRNAPAILAAGRGALIISDGDHSRSLELDAGQLQNGSVIYRRITNRVKFRLEVFIKANNSVSEIFEFTLAPPGDAAPPPSRAAERKR